MTKPATERPRLPSVGRLGLVDPPAGERLAQLGWYDRDDQEYIDRLWSLSRAPDPDAVLRAVIRLSENLNSGWDELNAALLTERGLRGRLFAVLGSSLALGDHLAANPQSWKLLRGKVQLPSREQLLATFTECVDEALAGPGSALQRLRTLYRDRLLVLAALDLAATVEDEPVLPFTLVAAQLSDLADAALAAALRVAEVSVCGERTPPRLAIIAMGKCGARELNYVSDVDVIFVAEHADALSARVAGEMMRVASAAFFQVDAGLRPEGRNGELVRTVESHVAYYQRWAKTWEFQALLKARAAVGDAELGERYLAALMPMVWVACEREDFVVEVQAMRRRVEQLVPADVRAREIKLGSGGLRDVEFAVQLLQLVHGRSDESLHVASTVDALAALGQGGYIGREDAANLTASYEFLRLLEHRLQLQRLKRTHLLPEVDDEEAVRWLARAAHIRPDGRHDAAGVLREELRHQNVRVSQLHAKLFYQPLLESIGPAGLEISHGMTSAAAERQLAALGYEGPQTALKHMSALVNQSGRRGRVQSVLLPRLLNWMSYAPDPDGGLLAYRRLSEALAAETLVPVHAAGQARGGQAADACAGDLRLRAGPVDARAQGHSGLQRRTGRPETARDRARRGGPGADRLGGPPPRPGAGHRRRALAAPSRAGPHRFRRPARHARCHRRVHGAHLGVGGGAAGRSGRDDPGQPSRRRQGAGGHRGHRHGQAGRRRAGLRVRRRRDVRLRAGPWRRGFAGGAVVDVGRRAGSGAAGHPQRRPAAGTRRQPAARGPQRSAGPHAGRPTPPTTSSGRSRGRSRPCCARTRSPATPSWASGSC